MEYVGNNTYCSYCGLLGHTIGLCRRKSQADGKAVVVEHTTKANMKNANPPKGKDNTQWVAKGVATTSHQAITPIVGIIHAEGSNTQNNQVPKQVEVLKRPENGITEDTRRALEMVGLLTNSDKEADTKETENDIQIKEPENGSTLVPRNPNASQLPHDSPMAPATNIAQTTGHEVTKEISKQNLENKIDPKESQHVNKNSGAVMPEDMQSTDIEHQQKITTSNQFHSLSGLEGESLDYHSDSAAKDNEENDVGSKSDGESHSTVAARKRKYNRR